MSLLFMIVFLLKLKSSGGRRGSVCPTSLRRGVVVSQRWVDFIVVPSSPEALEMDNIVPPMEQLSHGDRAIRP
jgi:hypothetical protein